MTTWNFTNIDNKHYLKYCFQNEYGFYRTGDLRKIYQDYGNKSNVHAIFAHTFNNWCRYWFMGPGLKRVNHKSETVNSFFRHMYQFLGKDIYRLFDPDDNSDCDICKFNISRIIQIYDDYFKVPEYHIQTSFYDSGYRPNVIHLEYPIQESNYVKPQPIPWEEKYKAIVYRKGHRGAISTWLSRWYV